MPMQENFAVHTPMHTHTLWQSDQHLTDQDLGDNKFWQQARLRPLPWHDRPGEALVGEPRFSLHPSIVDAVAPSMPLKAVFSRLRE